MSWEIVSSDAIIYRAGAGANATIIASGAYMTKISDEAQSELITETRVDWVGKRASILTATSGALSKAVALKAAKEIVGYDMSGYTSRQEALILLDFLDDQADKLFKKLSDKDVQKFMGV